MDNTALLLYYTFYLMMSRKIRRQWPVLGFYLLVFCSSLTAQDDQLIPESGSDRGAATVSLGLGVQRNWGFGSILALSDSGFAASIEGTFSPAFADLGAISFSALGRVGFGMLRPNQASYRSIAIVEPELGVRALFRISDRFAFGLGINGSILVYIIKNQNLADQSQSYADGGFKVELPVIYHNRPRRSGRPAIGFLMAPTLSIHFQQGNTVNQAGLLLMHRLLWEGS